MSKEFSHSELTEMVIGKTPKAHAVFYEKARLLIDASKEAGRRVYKPQTYIKLSHPGVTDVISYAATDADIAKYPEEYEYYMQNRQGVRETVPVSIIPNVTLSHMQELHDIGLTDVKKLAEVAMVPPHLEYARQSAITLNRVLQEQKNAFSQEESDQEESPESIPTVDAEARSEVRTLSQTYRQKHTTDVGQRRVQEVESRSTREPAIRNDEGRLEHNREHVNPVTISDNWKVDLTWSP